MRRRHELSILQWEPEQSQNFMALADFINHLIFEATHPPQLDAWGTDDDFLVAKATIQQGLETAKSDYMSAQQIFQGGVATLTEALKVNKALSKLDLSYNSIRSVPFRPKLAQRIAKMKRLRFTGNFLIFPPQHAIDFRGETTVRFFSRPRARCPRCECTSGWFSL